MIEVNDLSKKYVTADQEVLALDHVSFSVEKGEIFGIIGLSGAGKSTLVRCINMLERPTSGRILVDNQEVTTLGKRELRLARQKIGMIFQHFNLLSSRTVFDNVIFPLEIAHVPRRQAAERARELLELVELSDKATAYPSQLSGGQKQRVGIARALANDPKLLLSDEATSALDPQTTQSILDLLKDINRRLNLTILLITHDMSVIKRVCDRVAVIDSSHIVEIGSVADVFSRPRAKATRSFVGSVINHDLPPDLLATLPPAKGGEAARLLRLIFVGDAAGEPVINSLVSNFQVQVNILQGNIERIKNTSFGYLTVELTGRPEAVEAALQYLAGLGIAVDHLN